MQHKQVYRGSSTSFQRFKISALIGVTLVLLGLSNIAVFLLSQTPDTANAYYAPAPVVSEKPTQAEPSNNPEPVTTSNTSPAPSAQPKPASSPKPTQPPHRTTAPAAASKPAPAYDKVSIASINLSAKFVTVGLTATNAIDVHPSLVGWWNGSAQPGTPGAVFLDGHNPGIFSKLPKVKIGDQIIISKANGETFTYVVAYTVVVPLIGINMQTALAPFANAVEGLNLMTCVGSYNPKTGTTDQRLIVYAVRI